jgi:hypothetical protein
MLPGNFAKSLKNVEPGGVGPPDGFAVGVIPLSTNVPSFFGIPP